MGSVPRIGFVGTGGFRAVHLHNIERLRLVGRLSFAGSTDVAKPDPQLDAQITKMGGRFFGDYDDLPRRGGAAVVVVPTQPYPHREMTCAALAAGANALVERLPAVLVTKSHALSEAREGRFCQVGFQSLGSSAIGGISERASGRCYRRPSLSLHFCSTREAA